MQWRGGASLAVIRSSEDQDAVMEAMRGVDGSRYPQVFIGGLNKIESGKKNWYWKGLEYLGEDIPFETFGYTNFMEELVDGGGENCLAFINRPWPGTQRGQWNDVPCNRLVWSYICSVIAAP